MSVTTTPPKAAWRSTRACRLIEQRLMVYQDRGTWHSLSIADWATYKGMLLAQFQVDGMPVFVVNTHLNANYLGVWHPSNRLSRILQRQVGPGEPGYPLAAWRIPGHPVWRL